MRGGTARANARTVRAPEAHGVLARTYTSPAVLSEKERADERIESGLTEEQVAEVRIPLESETPVTRRASAILRARTTASANIRVRGTCNALNDRKSTSCKRQTEQSREKSKTCTPSWSKWGSLAPRFATLHARAHTRTHRLSTCMHMHMPDTHMPTPHAHVLAGATSKTAGRGGTNAFLKCHVLMVR